MRKRLFSELTGAGAADLPDPAIAAYLLVEETRVNVVLHRHNAEGYLLGESVHGTVAQALQTATEEYRGRVGMWADVPMELPSMAAILQERLRLRIESGGPPTLRMLRYERAPIAVSSEWMEPAHECLWNMLVFAGFCLIVIDRRPLGVLLARDWFDTAGPFVTDAAICLAVSTLLWWTRQVRIFTGIVGVSMLLIQGAIWALFLERGLGSALLALVSAVPLAVVGVWRLSAYWREWAEG